MRQLYLGLAALLFLAAAAPGCKDKNPIIPEPNPPQFQGDPVLVQDTSTATTLGYVRTRFTWETDRASIDVLYYGLAVDALHDSVLAQNVDTPVGDLIKHLHQAPAAGVAPVNVPSHQAFFYRLRALGANGQSGFTQVYRFHYASS